MSTVPESDVQAAESMPSVTSHASGAWVMWGVIGLLSLHTGLLAWGAYRHSPTFDEVAYLPAGMSHWEFGRFDLASVSPPLVRLIAAVPVVLSDPETEWRYYDTSPSTTPAHQVGRDFTTVNAENTFWLFTLARWACIPFSLLGAWVCFLWARSLYGPVAGVMACGLWCLSPNILAHAQLMTPDVGTTAFAVAAAFTFWRWIEFPSWRAAIMAGTALGLAQLTKSTLVVLFPMWPLVWLVCRWNHPGERVRELRQLCSMLVLALYLLNLGYGFQGTGRRLSEYSFQSRPLAGESETAGNNRFAAGGLGWVPVPLPANYLLGIDFQKRQLENRAGNQKSYLAGQWRDHGWWYYYVYALAIKVPLGTWLLMVLAVIHRWQTRGAIAQWQPDVILLVPLVTILVLVSAQTGFNHHMRYVLPVFPFAFIFISQTALFVTDGPRLGRSAVLAAAAWSAGSSLFVYPHSLSYFNELVGGPRGGHAHLVDSNIDWGQDLLYLRDWMQRHPEATPLSIAYFGNIDPAIAGIEVSRPPAGGPSLEGETDLTVPARRDESPCEYGPKPGWYAVSVNYVRGVTWNVGVSYRYFLEFEPADRVGFSILIYHISPEEADRVRRQRGLPPLTECD